MPRAIIDRRLYRVKLTHPTKDIPPVTRYVYVKHHVATMLRQANTLWPGVQSQVHIVRVPNFTKDNIAQLLSTLTKELVEIGETFVFDKDAEFVKIEPDKIPTTDFHFLDSFPRQWFQ